MFGLDVQSLIFLFHLPVQGLQVAWAVESFQFLPMMRHSKLMTSAALPEKRAVIRKGKN